MDRRQRHGPLSRFMQQTTNSDERAWAELDQELAQVTDILQEIAGELDEPLNQLVVSQIRRASPHRRAGVVLAFGAGEQDDDPQRMRRISLAAALEMLYIAQRVHHLLLQQQTEAMDKSLMGSIILAGDFCFSRAADLAVRTENPDIVQVFSDALKRLSENNLRTLFDQDTQQMQRDGELLVSGIEAALLLAASVPDPATTAASAQAWAAFLAADAPAQPPADLARVNPQQAARIRGLIRAEQS